MTPKERKSIDNAIWLCTACADRVDVDEQKYPVTLLRAWKEKVENLASRQLGSPIPNHNDALKAFGILGGCAPFDSNAIIPGVHGAYKQKLESMDPRLKVDIDYTNGVQTYRLEGKGDMVCFDLNYACGENFELDKNINDVLIHGGIVDVSGTNMTVKGSPILEFISGGGYIHKMVIGDKEDVTCKLEIFDQKTKLLGLKAISSGTIYRGTSGFRLLMSFFDGLFSIEFKSNFNNITNSDEEKILIPSSVSFYLGRWNNRNINNLQYFDELLTLCKLLSEGNSIDMSLIFQNPAAEISTQGTVHQDVFKELLVFLEYWDAARVLSKQFEVAIPFNTDLKFSDNDLHNLKKYASIILNGSYKNKNKSKKSVCSLTVNVLSENIEMLISFQELTKSRILGLQHKKHETIEISGVCIELPLEEIIFHNVVPRLSKKAKLVVGNSVEVKFYPAKGSLCEQRFIAED